jgi:hypothetical protein
MIEREERRVSAVRCGRDLSQYHSARKATYLLVFKVIGALIPGALHAQACKTFGSVRIESTGCPKQR